MAVVFGTLLIDQAELRSVLGDPSLDPTSNNYVSDETLDAIIERYTDLAENRVDERVKNLTIEQIVQLGLHRQAVQTDITPATGSALYPNLGFSDLGTDAATSVPVPVRVVDQTSGNELANDPDILNTRRATNNLFTSRRYSMDGDVLVKLPANTNTLSVFLVPLAAAEDLFKGEIAQAINQEIINEGRRMQKDRSNVAQSFREENQTDSP